MKLRNMDVIAVRIDSDLKRRVRALSFQRLPLMPFEVLNAARYARKDVSQRALVDITQSLTFCAVRLHNLQGEYCTETVEIALENGISTSDASYVALAKQLKTVMYTSDQNLIANLLNEDKTYVKHIKDYTPESN